MHSLFVEINQLSHIHHTVLSQRFTTVYKASSLINVHVLADVHAAENQHWLKSQRKQIDYNSNAVNHGSLNL